MKLRIKGDSLRLRVSPSETRRLLDSGRVEETIHFGPGADSRLTYSLAITARENTPAAGVTVRYANQEVAVLISPALGRAWVEGDDVGLYGELNTAAGRLEIAVEKDFACLDRSDAENADTFPNPHEGAVC